MYRTRDYEKQTAMAPQEQQHYHQRAVTSTTPNEATEGSHRLVALRQVMFSPGTINTGSQVCTPQSSLCR